MTILFIIGRVLVGAFFLLNAWNHFKNVGALAGYAQSKHVPRPKLAVIVSGVTLAIGGLSILTGFFIILGMWLLVLTLVGITFTMHPFWTLTDPMARQMDMIQFNKNMAIIGALLMLSAILALIG